MSLQEHKRALEQANDAVRALYSVSQDRAGPAATGDESGPTANERLAQKALDCSAALTDPTAALLEHDNPAVREVGVARLAALAARDFAIAHDMAALANEREHGLAVAEAPSALKAVNSDIEFVLTGDPIDGLPYSAGADGAELATADEDARATLRLAAPKAELSIGEGAIAIVKASLKGIGAAAIANAAAALLAGIVNQLPKQAQHWYRKARDFLLQGVSKLSAVFGNGFRIAITSVQEWLSDKASEKFANEIFGLDGLKKELEVVVGDAAHDRPFAKLGEDVDHIVRRFSTQKKVVLAIFTALGFGGKWLVNLVAPGYGTAVVDALYVLGAVYGVFVAGDYIDWRRTEDEGAFDFVVGVRRTLEGGLT